jgi:peptide/nickel transport system substrate-binding protein
LGGTVGPAKSGAAAPRPDGAPSFPRDETLYSTGTMYSTPASFNPLDVGGSMVYSPARPSPRSTSQGSAPSLFCCRNLPHHWVTRYATGTMGLLYETLFLYDPVHEKYVPWLATSGGWTGAATYTLHVRSGVKWDDGSPLTGADVAFSIDLAKMNPAAPYSYLGEYLSGPGAVAKGGTVTVHFVSPPPYAAWQEYLWTEPVLPMRIWSKLTATDQVIGPNTHPVSTGPMLLGYYGPSEVAYKVNPNWWGAQLGLHIKFRYLVDLVTATRSTELTELLSGHLDWSNSFLPGIANLVSSTGIGGYNLRTYYPGPPYMLPAGSAALVPNTARAPMGNVDLRKALAYALDRRAIVSKVYSGVAVVSDPTGLPPNLASFLDKKAVKRYEFSHNAGLAKKYLMASGYKGGPLTLEVPAGEADLAAAADVIVQDLRAVGIEVNVAFPSYDAWEADMANGSYDLTIVGQDKLDASPWSYFDRVYQLPIGGASNEQAAGINVERFTDPKAFRLAEQAGTTPAADLARLQSTYKQLEIGFLQELPEIPLWYGPAFFQANTTDWAHVPSSSERDDQYTPVMWPGWLGSTTTVLALAQLVPRSRRSK